MLDMDGTIYLGNNLFDGVTDFLAHVKSIGGRYIFLTNNSSKGVSDYIKKLGGMGIHTEKNDFLTSVNATVRHLKNYQNGKKIYVLGTESFKQQLREEGLSIVDRLEKGIEC